MQPETSLRTLEHYESNAVVFREQTIDHDVSQNVRALLGSIEGTAPFKILDFGCGPGRDLNTFRDLGHQPTGLDGCESFVEMSRASTGVDVWHQDFLSLSLPSDYFDGIFANASLFHIPSLALPRVLGELRAVAGRALWLPLRIGSLAFAVQTGWLRTRTSLLSTRGVASSAAALASHGVSKNARPSALTRQDY